MFNVQNKIYAAFAITLVMAGCSNSESTANNEQSTAQSLLTGAKTAADHHDYVQALSLLDSLHRSYPDQTEIRQQAVYLLPEIIKDQMLNDSIPWAEGRMASLSWKMDSLSHLFKEVKMPGFDSYMVSTKIKPGLSKGLEPRLGNDTNPWTIAVRNSRLVTEVAVNGSVILTVNNAAERNVNDSGQYLMSFDNEEANKLAQIIAAIPEGQEIYVKFDNDPGKGILLSKDMRNAITDTWMLATTKEQYRQTLVKRELYERKLITARNQIANNPDATTK